MMEVPQLDLTRYIQEVLDEWIPLVREIALSGKILKGSHKAGFEQEFAEFLGAKHALGVASGTDAIFLALRALDVGPGDEVITHANTFIADIEAILAAGGQPILVDMSSEDYGPDCEALESAITAKTKAVLVAHLYGMPASLKKIQEISQKHNIPLVEDAAQAQGAVYDGKKAGTFGVIGTFSLGTVKNLGALGDAGAVVTNDEKLYEKLNHLAFHGQAAKYHHVNYGWNSRLDEIHAAWLRLGLKTLDKRNQRRREIYDKYRSAFVDLPLSTMPELFGRICVFHQAIVTTSDRDKLQEHLKEKGVGTGIYYPYALHHQEAWHRSGLPKLSFPRAEKFSKENLSLPMFAELTDEEAEYVVQSVREFFKK
jgi:dTDP-4-amino-4,6-dideoxygalactose transaminase